MTAAAPPIGQILIERGLIAADDLERALELQRERRGEKLGRILVDMGYLAQRDLLAALSHQLGLPIAQLAAPPSAPELEGMSPRFLRQALIFPVAIEEGALTLAMADPLDFETINAVRASTKLEVRPQFAAEQEILDAIERYYTEGERQSATCDFAGGRRGRSRTSARHGERSARHPARQRDDRAGRRKARQRHPHRAFRKGIPHPLPHRWRAVQPGAAAPRTQSRHHFAA